jgi:HEAT repeat protein
VDEEMIVRSGAARAIGTWGYESGELLLRLKVLTGDDEPDVLGECFTGLLAARTERSLNFVGDYLDDVDDGVAEAAILALGESRAPRAMELLIGKWHRTAQRPMRKVLLLAFASARQEPAFDFLIGLIANENAQTARDAVAALQVCQDDERIMQRVAAALAQREAL